MLFDIYTCSRILQTPKQPRLLAQAPPLTQQVTRTPPIARERFLKGRRDV